MRNLLRTSWILLVVLHGASAFSDEHNLSISLWGGLNHGASIQEVASVLASRDDIKKVKIKKKKKIPVSLKISYREKRSVEVAGRRMIITPEFDEAGLLRAVDLTVLPQGFLAVPCLPWAFSTFRELDSLLKTKYIVNEESGASSVIESELANRIARRKIDIIGASSNNNQRLPEILRRLKIGYDGGLLQVTNLLRVTAKTYFGSSTSNQGMMNLTYNLCKNSAGFYGENTIRYASKEYYDSQKELKKELRSEKQALETERQLLDL